MTPDLLDCSELLHRSLQLAFLESSYGEVTGTPGMTEVWVTAYGGRYHSSADCQGILDGHQKAASEGRAVHRPTPVALRSVGELSPCARCWSDEFASDPWASKVHLTEVVSETEYESLFLRTVLRRVRGLDPRDVEAQRDVHVASGHLYRVDFVIDRVGQQPIALEVDGWEKTYAGNEWRPEARDRANARRHDLENAGWRILNFSNSQVATNPDACIRQIERALARGSASTPSSTPSSGVASLMGSEGASVQHQAHTEYRQSSVWPSAAAQTYEVPTEQRPRNGLGWFLLISLLAAGAALAVAVFGPGISGEQTDAVPESEVAAPTGDRCPSSHQIKGNRSESGDWIYHAPGWEYYDRTDPEECFVTTGAAGRAGYRASEVR